MKKSKRTGFQRFLNYNFFKLWIRITKYKKHPLLINKDTDKIFFLVDSKEGVIEMRAKQPSTVLNRKGYNSSVHVKNLPNNIENSVIIFVKYFPFLEVRKATKKNCLIIYDIVDDVMPHLLEIEGKIADAIIFPNKVMEKDFKPKLSKYTKSFVSYHNWDPKVETKNKHKNEFSLAYFGSIPDKNALFHKEIPELNIFEKFEDHVKNKGNFTCFYSMRKERTHNFLYKPSTKVSTAAAMDANIITSRESSAVELLGEDYPYFTDANLGDVKTTVEYAKKTFGGPVWKKGLRIMKKVKDKTDMRNLVNDYINIIESFKEIY